VHNLSLASSDKPLDLSRNNSGIVRVENGPSKIRGQRAKDFADRFVSFGGLGHGLM
jgi:hypothetical protein